MNLSDINLSNLDAIAKQKPMTCEAIYEDLVRLVTIKFNHYVMYTLIITIIYFIFKDAIYHIGKFYYVKVYKKDINIYDKWYSRIRIIIEWGLVISGSIGIFFYFVQNGHILL